MTWYRPTKNAAAKGINDLISKIVEAGLKTIRTPTKPIKIAIHTLVVTFSFNIITDKATTITGHNAPTLWASAKDMYLKAKTKHPDSIIDNILLKNWSL